MKKRHEKMSFLYINAEAEHQLIVYYRFLCLKYEIKNKIFFLFRCYSSIFARKQVLDERKKKKNNSEQSIY